MGVTISTYLDDKTEARLRKISRELGRDISELAQTSIDEAALEYFRHRNDDPGKGD